MNRNHFWKLVFIGLVVAWSLYEMYPPKGRDLVQVFQERARGSDGTFSNIVYMARELQKAQPDRAFGNLQTAIGTNDITKYFPFMQAKNELYPTTAILNRLQREAAGRIKLGIDLQGGTLFLVSMDTNRLVNIETITNSSGQVTTVTNQLSGLEGALSQAVEVLRRRVDRFGVAEPIIQPAGNNRIMIQLPGLSESDKESAKKQIQRAAFLEFRMVHEDSDKLIESGEVPPGYVLLKRKERSSTGREEMTKVIVKKKPERGLTGSAIKSAMVTRGNMGEPEIDFTLNPDGAALFGEITRENIGRRLAIVLDGELYSAPVIQGAIETGRGQITGRFDLAEAFELANVLENPLKAPLQIEYSNDVDPTLGKDSIRSGIKASIYGVIAVAAFMLIYYLFAGVVANVALMLNIVILLGVMCSIGTTLTLPGIAGVVLTIGMAVDANVLIFERIREELAAGKSMRGALSAGYDKAFGTIFDSNLTTLISSVILIFMGTGPVKGFGVTLTIGVTVSMFSALVVTRLIFDWLLAKNLLKSLRMLQLVRAKKINFMRWALPAFVTSWVLILAGNGYGIFVRGHDVLGVEFAGGETLTLGFDQTQNISVEQLRSSIAKTGVGEALIGYQKDVGAGTRTLRVTVRDTGDKKSAGPAEDVSKKVITQLQTDFKAAKFEKLGGDKVGPTVGAELRNTAIYASLLALFGILIYVAFRYEFSFAVGAVIAIIHDILMTLGWYFLVGRELNATTVAAVLTIIGFSINDTIVIFDRIREDLKLGMRGTFREVMNQALNQTLSRTIITSGTVFLATFSLYIFGGGPVNDFAFTFLIGIITGTYSSIYIASAIVLWWHKGQRPHIGSQVAMQSETTPVKA
ncbi:MAG: protein translocase subunit SecD [Verrucomicrobia bacterium]|jgi:SecD/SecF fusion protein|nr:protein translocase subunit SecD [Verrucomicrobiota bacterium]